MLEELHHSYELVVLPFPPRARRRDYLELNPLGTVPLLTDGALYMTESSAICQFLADRSSPDSLSVPTHDVEYGSYLNWLHLGEATLTFPQTLTLRYGRLEPPHRRQPQVAADYDVWFKARLTAVERAMKTREYLCADRFTAADISVGYALKLAHRLGFGFVGFDATQRYWERLRRREGYLRAMKRQAHAMAEQGIEAASI
jgi:glutathione S-transferase